MIPVAVRVLARRELAHTWRSLVAIGLLAGLAAGIVTGALAVARRTATAHDRLLDATAAEDVRVTVVDDPELRDAIAGIELVEEAWLGIGMVAQVEDLDRVFYAGIVTGPVRPPRLSRPVVVDGRWFADDRADEVVVSEELAAELGLQVGDPLPLWLLTSEEIGRFDTGFGDPDGGHARTRIVGIVRAPEGLTRSSPVYAGAAFAAEHRAASGFGTIAALRLRGGQDAVPAFRRAFDLAIAGRAVAGDAAEFAPAFAVYPAAGGRDVAAATRATVGGVVIAAIAVGAAALAAVAQAFLRLHAGGAEAQRVERILGLTPGERILARVLPGTVAALLAAATAAGTAAAAGWLEPLGRARLFEPSPGWRWDAAIAVPAVLLTAVVVLGLTAVGAAAASRGPARPGRGGAGPLSTFLARCGAAATTVAGVGFATGPAPDRRGRAVRSATVAIAAGTAVTLAFATIGAAIAAVAADPGVYGADADLAIIDTSPRDHRALLADPRIAELTAHARADVQIAGGPLTSGTSLEPLAGAPRWHTNTGRLPRRDDEVALGSLLARDLDLRLGSTVSLVAPDGEPRRFEVVGTGVGPTSDGGGFGREVLLTGRALEAVQRTDAFGFATVGAADGVDLAALTRDLAAAYELGPVEPPTSVASLFAAARLPDAVAVVVGLVALIAGSLSLRTAVRRRHPDLAILRALGMTPAELRRVASTLTVTATLLALAIGVPLGTLAGRLAWWAIAHDIGIHAPARVPVTATIVTVLVAIAAAVVAGTVATRGGADLRPSRRPRGASAPLGRAG